MDASFAMAFVPLNLENVGGTAAGAAAMRMKYIKWQDNLHCQIFAVDVVGILNLEFRSVVRDLWAFNRCACVRVYMRVCVRVRETDVIWNRITVAAAGGFR